MAGMAGKGLVAWRTGKGLRAGDGIALTLLDLQPRMGGRWSHFGVAVV